MNRIDGRVFISYSHADIRWLKRLRVHLRPATRDFNIDVWDDTRLVPGSQWRKEIRRAIDECDIAILLVSADFLASDFIRDNELPPLLQAAEQKGKLVLPVILSACLFLQTEGISALQAVNDPARPLLDMPKGEREAVFRDIAVSILERRIAPRQSADTSRDGHREDFFQPATWQELLKIGNWVPNPDEGDILGSGMHSYLLTRGEFGTRPFQISARLKLTPLPMTGPVAKLGMNAGLVVGYHHEKPNPRYVHLSFTGSECFLERIGFKGGTVIRDWEHVTENIPFPLGPGEPFTLKVAVNDEALRVVANGRDLLSANNLSGLQGRVGLRPWRSTMACDEFVVEDT